MISRSESPIACTVCGGSNNVLHCDKQSFGQVWHVRRCLRCGHGFVSNPPSLERLNQIQSNLEAHTSESASDRLTPPSADPENVFLARRIAAITPARGKTLDVGSGGGSSTLCLHQEGFGPHLLIDFDSRAGFAVEHIPNGSFRQMAFEKLTMDDGPFDVIVMSHVLEHALHPLEWLEQAARLLSPQGILAIAIPNFGGVYRFLGERDPWIIPPIHLQHFTPSSMRQALSRSGLRLVKMASRSHVTLDPVDRKLSLKSRAIRHVWNTLALLLNQTARGIVLHAYARKATPEKLASQ